jgi:hypothetical protein
MYVAGGTLPQPEGKGLTQPEIEVEADRIALRKGLSYMLTHPRDEMRLSVIKLRALYESDATALDWNSGYDPGYYGTDSIEDGLRDTANAYWFTALILAAAGLAASLGRWRDGAILLPLLVLSWTATHLLFFGDPRFHYPIVFVFAILVARGALFAFYVVRRPLPSLRKKGYATA